MARRHLSVLVLPAVLFTIVAVGGVGLVAYSETLVDTAESRRASQAQQLSVARSRHANAGLEKEIITRYSGVYDALADIGFVGAEQRLDWVDSLRAANREANLFGVEYMIGQQEDFTAAADFGAAGLPMHQSVMRVKLPLLHEGDLMNFFRHLAAHRAGVFVMNSCTLLRTTSAVPSDAQPNLNADCELTWVTVDETAAEVARP